jgi:hypothetical protein
MGRILTYSLLFIALVDAGCIAVEDRNVESSPPEEISLWRSGFDQRYKNYLTQSKNRSEERKKLAQQRKDLDAAIKICGDELDKLNAEESEFIQCLNLEQLYAYKHWKEARLSNLVEGEIAYRKLIELLSPDQLEQFTELKDKMDALRNMLLEEQDKFNKFQKNKEQYERNVAELVKTEKEFDEWIERERSHSEMEGLREELWELRTNMRYRR